MSQKDKDRLHKRHKIENIFCRIDKFKRIYNRMEQKASHFKSLNFLAAAIMTLEGIKRLTIDQSLLCTFASEYIIMPYNNTSTH